jgi:hypothetical protein
LRQHAWSSERPTVEDADGKDPTGIKSGVSGCACEHGRERLESIEKQISTQSRGSAPRVQRDAFHTLSSQRVT